MIFPECIFILLLPVLSSTFPMFSFQSTTNIDFCYDGGTCGQPTWAETCVVGQDQSPIDLPPVDVLPNGGTLEHFPKSTYNISGFTITNSGVGVDIVPTNGDNAASFFWPLEGGRYKFHSLNFHWGKTDDTGSEHTFDTKHFPMEAHLVHFSNDFETLEQALDSNRKNALVFLTAMLQIEPFAPASRFMYPIVHNLGKVKKAMQSTTTMEDIDLSKFIQGSKAYCYYGSLTFPPCLEQVVWLILDTPVKISALDVAHFRKLEGKNSRPLLSNHRATQNSQDRNVTVYSIHYADPNRENRPKGHKQGI